MSANRILTALCGAAAAEIVATISVPETCRRALQRLPEVRQVTDGMASGALLFDEVGPWVQSLLTDLRPGVRLEHEPALAALAVGLTSVPGHQADDLLRSLAEVGVAELTMASRVAAACVAERRQTLTTTTERRVVLSQPRGFDVDRNLQRRHVGCTDTRPRRGVA